MAVDTSSRRASPPRVDLHDPQALYELWERQQWSAHAIDLTRDRDEWETMALGLRERLAWHMAAFFVGEERVTVELAPLLGAARSASEAAFVATQLADEARHAQHFDRFYQHVAGQDGGFAARLELARSSLGGPFVALLDTRLAEAARRLAGSPRDLEAKVDFVVLYHMVIEGTLAITGQRVLLEFLDERALLTNWREGLRLIARDEHRHVAYGAWVLAQHTADPALRRRIRDQLSELQPLAAQVLVPPGARPEYFRPLGRSGAEMQAAALASLRRRMLAIGIDLPVVAAASTALRSPPSGLAQARHAPRPPGAGRAPSAATPCPPSRGS